MSFFESYLFDNNNNDLASIINSAAAGIWAFDLNTKQVTWSTGFYKILGYGYLEKNGRLELEILSFFSSLTVIGF